MSQPSESSLAATSAVRAGLLLIGHGTRDESGVREMREVAELVRRRLPEVRVASGFLEFADPTIPQGIDALVAEGVRQITVAPLLLFAAGHAKEDIPHEIERARGRYPGVAFRQASPLGCHRSLVRLSALRYEEALNGSPVAARPEETLLLMVGRGSHDPEANAEMARFARLRWEATPVGWLETCYKAMTEPSLPRAIDLVGRLPFRRVVVQPHLLFQGVLLREIGQEVERARAASDARQWIVTQHLGVHELLADAIVQTAGG